jgi:copper chaperone CopZ
MAELNNYKMRIENCVNTIIEVHKFLGSQKVNPEILDQFRRLKDVVEVLNIGKVTEPDIEKIELATNSLLNELKVLFEWRDVGKIYPNMKH